MKRLSSGISAAICILILILDSRTALTGAKEAIELCISSVIPSLFPFLVVTGILTSAINGSSSLILRPVGRIIGVPQGAEGIYLTGILGGYPAGAQAVYQAWKKGQLSRADATRMLAFSSNAGPAFLFGILGAKFADSWILWALWGIHILSSVAVAIFLPGRSQSTGRMSPESTVNVILALTNAVHTMGYICGWIILMHIILAFLDRWILWLFPFEVRVGIYGVLELTNGCCAADLISSPGTRFILCSAMLAFGGICVAMQTASVTCELGIGKYLQGKIVQTLISILLSMIVQAVTFAPADRADISYPVFAVLLFSLSAVLLLQWKREKKGSIPVVIGV